MNTRTFALIFGIVFLAVGIAGFIPNLVHPLPAEHPPVNPEGGLLLGLFPINALHNAVHILFGLWGLAASRSLGGARTYFRVVAVIYIVLTICGLIPPLDVLLGMVPLGGNDVWLHLVLALVAAYFGWVHRDTANA